MADRQPQAVFNEYLHQSRTGVIESSTRGQENEVYSPLSNLLHSHNTSSSEASMRFTRVSPASDPFTRNILPLPLPNRTSLSLSAAGLNEICSNNFGSFRAPTHLESPLSFQRPTPVFDAVHHLALGHNDPFLAYRSFLLPSSLSHGMQQNTVPSNNMGGLLSTFAPPAPTRIATNTARSLDRGIKPPRKQDHKAISALQTTHSSSTSSVLPQTGNGDARICSKCGVTDTPRWRWGLHNDRLCNACGLSVWKLKTKLAKLARAQEQKRNVFAPSFDVNKLYHVTSPFSSSATAQEQKTEQLLRTKRAAVDTPCTPILTTAKHDPQTDERIPQQVGRCEKMNISSLLTSNNELDTNAIPSAAVSLEPPKRRSRLELSELLNDPAPHISSADHSKTPLRDKRA